MTIQLRRYLLSGLAWLLMGSSVQATHIRAGDIIARRLPGTSLTYEFTVTIYTDDEGVPPDEEIEMFFGDGSPSRMVRRTAFRPIGNLTTENIYRTVYTFAGPGEFNVGVVIRNRNAGIVNIPNSVNTAFAIQSTFLISPFLGLNSSPILTNPPVDFLACSRRRFRHNPGAFDPDGDSLSYRFTISKKSLNQNVDIYYPLHRVPGIDATTEDGSRPATLTLDPITGDLIWDAPLQPGEYNVAFFVDEWRNGIRIGSVNRDMQIIVRECVNQPPRFTNREKDTCVVAGALVQDLITANDPDRNRMSIFGTGQVFNLTPPSNRATLDSLPSPAGVARSLFRWQTTCNDVSRQVYVATFIVRDFPNPIRNQLADFLTYRIRVIGPAPILQQPVYNPATRSATLTWNNYVCPNASTMLVFRRVGPSGWRPGPCETGIPASAGYELVGRVDPTTGRFIDTNGGRGLQPGITYCYRIYAIFPEPKGGESIASQEVCITVQTNAPLITNVSVERTATTNGEIFVRWIKPIGITPERFPRPWTYQVARAEGLGTTTNFTRLPQLFAENDTFFTDRNLDTENRVYNYRVYFFSQGRLIDSSAVASSVRLSVRSSASSITLTWNAQVPWNNNSTRFRRHLIYRERLSQRGTFDLIDSVDVITNGFTYTDRGRFQNQPLRERELYCYYVTTRGTYENSNVFEPLLNKSQIACAVLRDTTAPCPPTLSLAPLDCSKFNPRDPATCSDSIYENELSWKPNLAPPCDKEIAGYNLYFAPFEDDTLRILRRNIVSTTFIHQQINSVAGCYAVTALDSAGNESRLSNVVCNDNCPFYELPNVFTPNGDGKNDTFRPLVCPRFVERVEFRVYNRWGGLVYESNDDIFINWRGVSRSGARLPAGVYYYEAVVTFRRLNRQASQQILKGWVQIILQE
ncbi:MAG: gliding motility-associated C-terminal domain-containing protein [Cytophagales bacterium]|nr:gliding motility-associated C-terminal domain-containing protein [Bernardetiaceae bacterium]MDW8210284.1 gliding motility-associated C-terminal domain-containing protein [Cytophagales bacterium]